MHELNLSKKTKLVLGSAGIKDPEAITLDVDPKHAPDMVYDLNKTPWPFRDNQFKNILCHHVLEHLDDIDRPMKELHRICSNDGDIYIETPHRSSWCADSPHHKLRFSYFALNGYLEGEGVKWITNDKKFKVIEKKITFHKAFRRYLLHNLFNKFPLCYERFWAHIIPAENLIFHLQPIK